jgi:hypothetical protein
MLRKNVRDFKYQSKEFERKYGRTGNIKIHLRNLLVFLNKNLQYVIDIVTKNNFNGKYIIWLFN